MIRFSLNCEHEHRFDGWFSSSGDFERQLDDRLITCPVCKSSQICKSLMTPSVSTGRSRQTQKLAAPDPTKRDDFAKLKALRDKLVEGSQDVGSQFPEEARKIHYGEVEPRGIHGEANKQEVASLIDEGVSILALPNLPDKAN